MYPYLYIVTCVNSLCPILLIIVTVAYFQYFCATPTPPPIPDSEDGVVEETLQRGVSAPPPINNNTVFVRPIGLFVEQFFIDWTG